MNAELQQTCEDAFDDILNVFGETVVFSGERRESGADSSRLLAHSCSCVVGAAVAIDVQNDAIAKMDGCQYDVKVGRRRWSDHKPPQSGDILKIDGYPEMRCVSAIPTGYGWVLTCISKGALK